MPSGSSLSNVLSSLNPLRRRPSLRESIRSIVSSQSALKRKNKSRPSSYYHPYSVYEQTMFPHILRDPDATGKLLEAILDSPNGKRTLSRLARTCRALSDPALAILWRELDSLIPLIGLFPPSIQRKARKPGMGLTKAPAQEDWNKVLEYGSLVRRITYDESYNNVSSSIFPMLDETRPTSYILPNLKQLTWKAETPAGLDRCTSFVNPGIEGLTLELGGGGRFPNFSPFLANLSSRTSLTSFSFISSTTLPDSFTDLLLSQEALQRLVLVAPGALSPGVGRWIASLIELKSLQLDLSGRSMIAVEGFFDELRPRSGDSTPSSVGTTDSGVFTGDEVDFSDIRKSALRLTGDLRSKGSFANLRHLQLTGDVSNMAVFVRHLTSPLVYLDLVIQDPPDKADWQDLSSMICERFGSSLQSLRVTATGSSRFSDLVRSTSRAEPPSKGLSLEHLSYLPSLVRFEIDLPESVLFTASDVANLAAACPNVEEVKLCPLARFPVSSGPPKLSLEALAPLMGCDRLHTLWAVVHAKGGNSQVLASKAASSETLLRLHVGHSWVDDPLHVTILLSHFAPNLETLKWFRERNRPGFVEANAKAWQQVSDSLPHLQSVRRLERQFAPKVVEYVNVPVREIVETSEKGVGAAVVTIDRGVLVRPRLAEASVQISPATISRMVEAIPAYRFASIDATPMTSEAEVDASVTISEQDVEARPSTTSTGVDATPSTVSEGTETTLAMSPIKSTNSYDYHPQSRYLVLPSILEMCQFSWKIFISYPLSLPFRILHMLLETLHIKRSGHVQNPKNVPSASSDSDISMDTLQDISDFINEEELHAHPESEPEHEPEHDYEPAGMKADEEVKAVRKEVVVDSWIPKHPNQTNINHTATRHFAAATNSPSWIRIMADNKKQERDFTKEVDDLLVETTSLVESGKLQDALDKLFTLEKQTRNAADLASTTRLVKAVIENCYKTRNFTQLNTSATVLSKKHGQLKSAVQAMVEQMIGWLEDVKKAEGVEKWLEILETLRGITEGKIFLETPRARVTLLLSQYHESLSGSSSSPAESKKSLLTASELLSDLQVETYSSMERREKTEFILEQMRLLIAVARLKDAEVIKDGKKDSLGDGEADWVKVRVGGRKVSEAFLKEAKNEDLKLKYYGLMIEHALHHSEYLEVAKHYHKVWETPSIKEDVNDKGKQALEHIVYYVVLAPHNNEQSDLLNRLYTDPALAKLQLHYNFLKSFVTHEIMRWPGVQALYGEFLRETAVFSNEKRWEDLHTRVVEHNMRIIAKYYTRITVTRLTSLLDLTTQQTEETLARLVVSGTIWARIDRPAGVVNFRSKRSPEDVMNDWSSDMQKLLGLVEKTWMGMNAAQAAQSRVVKS